MSDSVGGEVDALLGEVAGEASASVVGFLVELKDALLYIGVGFSWLAFGRFGQVVPCLFAVLLVAFDPLAHGLGCSVASSCGWAGVVDVLVDVDDAFAWLGGGSCGIPPYR